MAKLTLNDVTSGYSAATLINANNAATEAALENTLSRDGTGPNEMEADLSLGGYRITNLAAPVNPNDAARYQDVLDAVSGGDLTIDLSADWPDITNIPSLISDIENFGAPGGDRLVFWDNSAGILTALTLGTGLSIAGTTISASVSSVAWADVTSKPAYITSLASLSDPNADRIVFWDDSAGALAHLTVSTGLSLTTTNLTLSHLGIQSLSDPGNDRAMFWDDSAGAVGWLTLGTGLTVTGTTLTADATALTAGDFIDITAGVVSLEPNSADTVLTLTGVSGTVAPTVKFTVVGDTCTLDIPEMVGTSNSTAHVITDVPTECRPTTTQYVIGVCVNNSVDVVSRISISSTGTITLYNGVSTTFAGTGTEGLRASTITYNLS